MGNLSIAPDNKEGGQAIITAAVELIFENNTTAISMRALAKKVGLHAGSLYHYFPSKTELFNEVLDNLTSDRVECWNSFTHRKHDASEKLRSFIGFCVSRSLHHSNEEALISELGRIQGAPETSLAIDEFWIRELSKIIDAGIKQTKFCVQDTDTAARFLLPMFSAAPAVIRGPRNYSEGQVVKTLEGIALKLLSSKA